MSDDDDARVTVAKQELELGRYREQIAELAEYAEVAELRVTACLRGMAQLGVSFSLEPHLGELRCSERLAAREALVKRVANAVREECYALVVQGKTWAQIAAVDLTYVIEHALKGSP